MPASAPSNKPLVHRVLAAFQPGSVLDVCAGWGEFGVLVREALPESRVEAIEIWEPYRSEKWDSYDEVHIGDAREVLPSVGRFDVALFLGALEHFSREDGAKMLRMCADVADSTVLVTPRDPAKQGAVFGNESERHISKWTIEDLGPYSIRDLSNRVRVRAIFGDERQGWWEDV